MKAAPSLLLLCFPILLSLFSCHNGKPDPDYKKYSFHLMTRDGNEYLVQSDSLENGELDPVQGAPVTPQRHFYDFITRDGYYYYVDKPGLVKSKIEDRHFRHLATLPLKGFSLIENYTWLGPDSLLLIGFDFRNSVTRFARVNVSTMTAEEGVVDIPSPFPPFKWISIGFTKFRDNGTLLIGYTYHTSTAPGDYTTSDTITIDVLDSGSMKSTGRYRDTRSSYPGGVNTKHPFSFTDENGDFYFISCPGIAGGNVPDRPTAIFKIRKGEDKPDPGYFFNISASGIANHGYGLWYIGNGRAIVRTERRELFTGINDHYKVAHFDFYVVDVKTQTARRLDLPLDKGSSRQCILVEKDKIYITVSPDAEKCAVWILDPQTLSLKKGLEFGAETEYILRIDAMQAVPAEAL